MNGQIVPLQRSNSPQVQGRTTDMPSSLTQGSWFGLGSLCARSQSLPYFNLLLKTQISPAGTHMSRRQEFLECLLGYRRPSLKTMIVKIIESRNLNRSLVCCPLQ